MKLYLEREIRKQLIQNAQKPENIIDKHDQEKFVNLLHDNFKMKNFSQINYDNNLFSTTLKIGHNLKAVFSQVLDKIQELIGASLSNMYFDCPVSRLCEVSLHQFLDDLTEFIFTLSNQFEKEPLIELKLRAIVKNLESVIIAFISSCSLTLQQSSQQSGSVVNLNSSPSAIGSLDNNQFAQKNNQQQQQQSPSMVYQSPQTRQSTNGNIQQGQQQLSPQQILVATATQSQQKTKGQNIFQSSWIQSLIMQEDSSVSLVILQMDIKLIQNKLRNLANQLAKGEIEAPGSSEFRGGLGSERAFYCIGLMNQFFQRFFSNDESDVEQLVQLYDYCFKLFNSCRQNGSVEKMPLISQFFIKLMKQRRQIHALDSIMKQQANQILTQMFKTVQSLAQKMSLDEIYHFCHEFACVQYIGFDNLEAIDFHNVLAEQHKQMLLMARSYKHHYEFDNKYFHYRKLLFITQCMEGVFAKSYDYEEKQSYQKHTKQSLLEKRIHQIIGMLSKFQEMKNTYNHKPLLPPSSLFKGDDAVQEQGVQQVAQAITVQNNVSAKIPEQVRAELLGVLKLSNSFLISSQLRKQNQGSEAFSASVMSDYVLPKFDLSGFLQKEYMRNQPILAKKMIKFYLNLIAQKDESSSIRTRALKDLQHALFIVFHEYEHDEQLLHSLANKLAVHYERLKFDEQINFLFDLLQVINNYFYEKESSFINEYKEKGKNVSAPIVERKKFFIRSMMQMLPLICQCCKTFLQYQKLDAKRRVQAAMLMTEFWLFFIVNKEAVDSLSLMSGNNLSGIAIASGDSGNLQPNNKQLQEQNSGDKLVRKNSGKNSANKEPAIPTLIPNRQSQGEDPGTKQDKKAQILGQSSLNQQARHYLNMNNESPGVIGRQGFRRSRIFPYSLNNQTISYIALLTPILLEGESITYENSKFMQLIKDAPKELYKKQLKKWYKTAFKIGDREQSHIPLMEIVHCLILQEIFRRRNEVIASDISSIKKYYNTSFLDNVLVYLKEIGVNAKTLRTMEKLVIEASKGYIDLLRNTKFQNIALKEQIISRDMQFLIEMSCSVDNRISQFSLSLLQDFIKQFPFIVFNPPVLMVFAETLTMLNNKCAQEYDSKSGILIGRHLRYGIALPTDVKRLGGILVVLMSLMQQLMLNGHFIDHYFLKVLVPHIIKQEASITSNVDFGYRFLKYVSISFRSDRNQVLDTILDNNPCLWITEEEKFQLAISKCNLSQYVIDRNMLELVKIKISNPPTNYKPILESIETSIHNEIETEFQLDDQKGNQNQQLNLSESDYVKEVIQDISKICLTFNVMDLLKTTKFKFVQDLLTIDSIMSKIDPLLKNLLIRGGSSGSNTFISGLGFKIEGLKSELKNKLMRIVASLKNVLMKRESVKNLILSSLLDVSRVFLQPKLLKYILMRYIPYMHSLQSSYFDSTLFYLLGEMLNYIVIQINTYGNMQLHEKVSLQDIFLLRCNYMHELAQQEIKDFTPKYYEVINQLTMGAGDSVLWTSMLTNHIGYNKVRLDSLLRMHKILMRFLNDNMQLHLAKGLHVSTISSILNLNFHIEKKMVEFIPLDTMCLQMKSWIEILQVQKKFYARFQFGRSEQEKEAHRQRLENYYYKMLKFTLSHFAKTLTIYQDNPILRLSSKPGKLRGILKLYLSTCRQLDDDKLNAIIELPKMSKFRKSRKSFRPKSIKSDNLRLTGVDIEYSTYFFKLSEKSTLCKRIEASIGYKRQSIFSLNQYYNPQAQTKQIRPKYLRLALIYFIAEQIDKCKACAFTEFIDFANSYSLAGRKISQSDMNDMLAEVEHMAPALSYYLTYQLEHCLEAPQQAQKRVREVVKRNYKNLMHCSQFLEVFIQVEKDHPQMMLREALYWKRPHVQQLLKFITAEYESRPELQLFFTKTMKKLSSEQAIFYLPQIFQALGSRAGPIIQKFMVEYAEGSVLFAHQLIWMAKVESRIESKDKNQIPNIPINLQLIMRIAESIIDKVLRNMDADKKEFFDKVNGLLERVTSISGMLRPRDEKAFKRARIKQELEKIIQAFPEGCYLPTNPRYRIVKIDSESGQPMQSAAKCPIMITFLCQKYEGPDKYFEKLMQEKKVQMQVDQVFYDDESIHVDDEDHETLFLQYLHNPLQIRLFPKDQIGEYNIDKINSDKLKQQPPLIIQDQPQQIIVSPNLNNHQQNKLVSPSKDIINQSQIKISPQKSTPRNVPKCKKQFTFNLGMDPKLHGSTQNNNNTPRKISGNILEIGNQQQQYLELNLKINSENKIDDYKENPNKERREERVACIFKVFDDVRQDCLALQIIHLFKCIFQKVGLELYVFPYKTISNRTGRDLNIGGIIECVNDTHSRDELGKINHCNLYQHFVNKFGNGSEDSANYQLARENFIRSQAPYSVISYILQTKDRHNGNILINNKGHLIHIDFGFIFDISPGHNMRFESANFKLTKEMIQIMGGSKDSEPFQFYLNLTIKCFIAIRKYWEHIYNIIQLMTSSSLPCFRKNSMKNLIDRFVLKKNDYEAAQYMKGIIYDAYDKLTTRLYDDIQYLQNRIYR